MQFLPGIVEALGIMVVSLGTHSTCQLLFASCGKNKCLLLKLQMAEKGLNSYCNSACPFKNEFYYALHGWI